MSSAAEIRERIRMAQPWLLRFTLEFPKFRNRLLSAAHEIILDWWDEPQIEAMIDDGCPNVVLFREEHGK